MGTDDRSTGNGWVATIGIPPQNPAVFAVSTQVCGAVMMAALGAFCLMARGLLMHGRTRWVERLFEHRGIPAEPRPEIWLLGGVFHLAWALVCVALAFVAARAVAKREAGRLRWATAAHAVSTLVVIAWGIGMANFVRWPLLFVGLMWLWTIWGHLSIVASWRDREG